MRRSQRQDGLEGDCPKGDGREAPETAADRRLGAVIWGGDARVQRKI